MFGRIIGLSLMVGRGACREQVHSIAIVIVELLLESHGLRERACELLGEMEKSNIVGLAQLVNLKQRLVNTEDISNSAVERTTSYMAVEGIDRKVGKNGAEHISGRA